LIDDESSIREVVVEKALGTVLGSGRSGEESGGEEREREREIHCSPLID
jgi:hypothetical protein